MHDDVRSFTGLARPGLRRVSPAAARWSQLLCDRRLSVALRRQWPELSLEVLERQPAPAALAVELASEGQTIEIEIAEADHPGWAMALGHGTSDALRHLAAQALFEPVASALEAQGLGRWWPSRATVRTASSTEASPWWCVRRHAEPVATLRITQAAPGWAEALKDRLCAQAGINSPRAGWALRPRVSLHTQRLDSALLASLNLGDVLVLPCPVHTDGWPVVVRWGATGGRALRVAGRMAGTTVVIEGAQSVANDDSDDGVAADDVQPLQDVRSIDVPVRFELETVPVPLSDIEALAPGYVLELTSPLERATLRLVVCGQVIGQAELVAVGEQLGARITRLGAK